MAYEELLATAVLAPSGDNLQPWKLEVGADQVRLWRRPEADNSLINRHQRATGIALGAVLENLLMAATAQGLAPQLRFFDPTGKTDLVAEVGLSKEGTTNEALLQAIRARISQRGRYDTVPLSNAQTLALEQAAAGFERVRLYCVTDNAQKVALAKLWGLNDSLIFRNHSLHSFLYKTLRWTPAEVDQYADGLDVRTLRLAAADRLALKHLLSRFDLLSALNRLGLWRFIASQSTTEMRTASALCLVTIDGSDLPGYLEAGRALQKLLVTAELHGLSSHMLSGLPLLLQLNREDDLHSSGFSKRGLQALRSCDRGVRELLEVKTDEVFACFFRLGVPRKGRLDLRSPRRQDLIVQAVTD